MKASNFLSGEDPGRTLGCPEMGRGLPVSGVLAAWVALSPAIGRAEEPAAPALNWLRGSGAEACIPAFELAERVEERLGRVVFVSPSEAEVFIDGYISRIQDGEAPGHRAVLGVSDREGRSLGERTLELAEGDCRAFDEALVLVIAVTLYPDTGLLDGGIPLQPQTAAQLHALFGAEPTDPAPHDLPQTVVPSDRAGSGRSPAAATKRVGPRPRAAPQPERLRFGIDAAALAGFGQLPGVALGLGATVQLRVASWSFELGAGIWPQKDVSVEGGGRASLSRVQASLTACPWQIAADLAQICAGLELGHLAVTPRDFAVDAAPSGDLIPSLFAAVVYRPVLAGALRARAALAAALPLVQHAYNYQTPQGNRQLLFRTTQLGLRLELGVGAHF